MVETPGRIPVGVHPAFLQRWHGVRGKWPLVAVASRDWAEGEHQCFHSVGSSFFRNRRAGRVRIQEHTSHPHLSLLPKASEPSNSWAPSPACLGCPHITSCFHWVLSGPLMETPWVSPSPSGILKASPQGSLTATITVWLLAVQPH